MSGGYTLEQWEHARAAVYAEEGNSFQAYDPSIQVSTGCAIRTVDVLDAALQVLLQRPETDEVRTRRSKCS